MNLPVKQLNNAFLFFVLLTFVFAGCSPSDEKEQAQKAEPEYEGIEKKYDRGPVTLVVRTDRKQLTIADKLHLSLLVTCDEDYEVELPAFGEKLESFGIADYETVKPQLLDTGKVHFGRIYTLEPFLSGEYTIPAMTLNFKKKNDPNANQHAIESEPLTIQVTSLLPENVAELDVKPIVGPLQLPDQGFNAWLLPIFALVLVCLGTGGYFWRRRKPKKIKIVRKPAHELAYEQLEQLIAADLIKKGQVKLFYLKISNILRHYVENRFGLHAPERTTEEFLMELSTDGLLNPDQKKLLQAFLTHCDLVKFAEVTPTTVEIQKTFDSCRTFIAGTKYEEEGVE